MDICAAEVWPEGLKLLAERKGKKLQQLASCFIDLLRNANGTQTWEAKFPPQILIETAELGILSMEREQIPPKSG